MKSALWVGVLVAAVLLSVPLVRSQENLRALQPEDFPRPQRPAVAFAHDANNEEAGIESCNECHHVYADGQRVPDESSEGQRCSDCHGLQDAGRQPGLMKAFHLSCKGCHQAQNKGPVMCGECHARR
jgi:hypothetical protein